MLFLNRYCFRCLYRSVQKYEYFLKCRHKIAFFFILDYFLADSTLILTRFLVTLHPETCWASRLWYE